MIQTKDAEFVTRVGMSDPKDPFRLIFRARQGWIQLTGIDGVQQKDSMPPDDRCGTAVHLDSDFPLHILPLSPFDASSIDWPKPEAPLKRNPATTARENGRTSNLLFDQRLENTLEVIVSR
ncbi:MAG: hypothetical protein M2R45_05127 [Verrucomicrobia subdivision 3 bacterium]|nr:hypothetical protein [Limisphaerales bacterium]MCS1417189.1 hypothetical protein [Limisphaerales bacterium]